MSNTDGTQAPEEVSKETKELRNKPDFFLYDMTTGFEKGLPDLYQDGFTHDMFSMQPADAYWKNPEIKGHYEKNNLTRKDFDEHYKMANDRLYKFSTMDFDLLSVSEPRALDTPLTRALGLKTYKGKTWRKATFAESGLEYGNHPGNFGVKTLKDTKKGLAQDMGIYDEKTNTFKDSSIWDVLGNSDVLRISRKIDENGNFQYNTTPGGASYLESVSSEDQLHGNDQILTMWNEGIFKDSMFDGNKLDESALSTLGRNAFKFIPYTRVVPFVMDVANGFLEVGKSINDLTADSKEYDQFSNKLINNLKKFNYDSSYAEQSSMFNVNSLVSNVSNIFSQLAGMRAISSITGAGAQGFAKLFTGSPHAASAFGSRAGSSLGMFSMGVSAASDMARMADEYDIPKRDAAWLHLGSIVAMTYTAQLSEKVLKGLQLKPEEVGAVFRKVQQQSIIDLGGKIPAAGSKEGWLLAQKIANKASAIVNKIETTAAKNPEIGKVLYGSFYEGLEEVTEDSAMKLIQSGYNMFGAGKDAKAGKGRFEDFNMGEYLKQSGTSFFYGAIGGGIAGSKLGKAMLDMSTDEELQNVFDFAQNEKTRKEYDKFLERNEKAYGLKNYSYATDKDGNYKLVNPDAVDPMEKMSQFEVNKQAAKAQWEYAKKLVDYRAGKKANTWTEEIDKLYKGRIQTHQTLMHSDLTTNFTKLTQLHREVDVLKEDLESKDPALVEVAENKKKELEKEISETGKIIDGIFSGSSADHYFHEALYEFNTSINRDQYNNRISPTGLGYLSFDAFNKLNETFLADQGVLTEKFKSEKEGAEGLSKKILETEDVATIAEYISQGPVTEEAKKHVLDMYAKHSTFDAAKKLVSDIWDERGNTKDENDPDYQLMQDAASFEDLNVLINDVLKLSEKESASIVKLQGIEKSQIESAKVFDDKYDSLAELRRLTTGESIDTILEYEAKAFINPDYVSEGLSRYINEIDKRINQVRGLQSVNPEVNGFKTSNKKLLENTELLPVLDNGKEVQELMKFYNDSRNKFLAYYVKSEINRRNPVEALKAVNNILLSKQVYELRKNLASVFLEDEHNGFVKNIEELLSQIESETEFDIKSMLMDKVEESIHMYYDRLPEATRKELAENVKANHTYDSTEKNEFLPHLRSILRLNNKKFNQHLLRYLENSDKSAPTYEQKVAIKQVVGKFMELVGKANGKSIPITDKLAELIPDKERVFSDSIYVKGMWGSGKTSYVAGIAAKIYLNMVKGYGIDKVLVASNNSEQVSKLYNDMKERGNNVVTSSKGNESNYDALIEDLNKEAGYLSEVGIIVYDEATFIPGDKLTKLHTAIKLYNSSKRKDKKPGIQLMFLGDHKQQGHYKVQKTNQQVQIIDDNIEHGFKAIERTVELEMSQRSGNVPIQMFLKYLGTLQDIASTPSTYRTGYNPNYETISGTNEKGEIAGVDVHTIVDEDVEAKNKKVQMISKMLAQATTKNKKFAYITDKMTQAKDGTITYDPEIIELLTKFPELKGNIISPQNVQGREFDFATVDLTGMNISVDENGVRNNPRYEQLILKMISVSASRAKQYILIFSHQKSGITNNRNWTTKQGEVRTSETLLLPEDFKTMRESEIANLKRMLGSDTEVEIPETGVVSLTTHEDLKEVAEGLYANFRKKPYTVKFNEETGWPLTKGDLVKFPDGNNWVFDRNEKLSDKLGDYVESYWSPEGHPNDIQLRKESEVTSLAEREDTNALATEFQKKFDSEYDTLNASFQSLREMVSNSGLGGKVLEEKIKEAVSGTMFDHLPLDKLAKVFTIVGDPLANIEGRKQIVRSLEKLKAATDPVERLNAVHWFNKGRTLSPDVTTKEEVEYVGKVIQEAKSQGYVIVDLEGMEFNDPNMVDIVNTIIEDETSILGTETISDVYSPLIKKDGKKVQKVEVVISKGIRPAPKEIRSEIAMKIRNKIPLTSKEEKIYIAHVEEGLMEKVEPEEGGGLEIDPKLLEDIEKVFEMEGSVPLYTWLVNTGGTRSFEDAHQIKLDALDLSDYSERRIHNFKYTLRVGSITDLEHEGTSKIIDKEAFKKITGDKVVYIEASWNGGTMLLGALPYASDVRARKYPKSNALIQHIIDNAHIYEGGLDVTIPFKSLLNTDITAGAIDPIQDGSSMTMEELKKKYAEKNPDKNPPIHVHTDHVYMDASKVSQAPTKTQRPFVYYSYSEAALNQFIEGLNNQQLGHKDRPRTVGQIFLDPISHKFNEAIDLAYKSGANKMEYNQYISYTYSVNMYKVLNGALNHFKGTGDTEMVKFLESLVKIGDGVFYHKKDNDMVQLNTKNLAYRVHSASEDVRDKLGRFVDSSAEFKDGIYVLIQMDKGKTKKEGNTAALAFNSTNANTKSLNELTVAKVTLAAPRVEFTPAFLDEVKVQALAKIREKSIKQKVANEAAINAAEETLKKKAEAPPPPPPETEEEVVPNNPDNPEGFESGLEAMISMMEQLGVDEGMRELYRKWMNEEEVTYEEASLYYDQFPNLDNEAYHESSEKEKAEYIAIAIQDKVTETADELSKQSNELYPASDIINYLGTSRC